jgi:hypothetical protein
MSVNFVLGIWLMIAAFFLAPPSVTRTWNEIIIGGALMIVSGRIMSIVRPAGSLSIEVALGAWLIVSPFVLNYAAGAGRWNDIICGLMAIVVALITWQTVNRPSRVA